MFDFKLVTKQTAPPAYTWNAFTETLGADGLYVFCNAPQPDTNLLTQAITAISNWLHQHASHMTDKQVAQVMRCLAALDECREEAELAGNPARRAGIERAAQRLAQRTEYEITRLFERA